jgi:hypothetical protein
LKEETVNVNENNLKKAFAKMGARVKFETQEPLDLRPWRNGVREPPLLQTNIRTDKQGEHFVITVGKATSGMLKKLQVLDLRPKDRHLVLQATLEEPDPRTKVRTRTDKFLMGHDERHWFIAGVQETVTTVQQAKESLKPRTVAQLQNQQKVKKSKRNKRHNSTFKRQGEWFFIPEPTFEPGKMAIVARNEPISRGRGSKPHMCQELCRVGGTTVMVHFQHAPNGISTDAYNRLPKEKRKWGWRPQTRNPRVYVRGTVRHADHKTLKLRGWHRVEGNAEPQMSTVAFLD